jgi:hypothetical protein
MRAEIRIWSMALWLDEFIREFSFLLYVGHDEAAGTRPPGQHRAQTTAIKFILDYPFLRCNPFVAPVS